MSLPDLPRSKHLVIKVDDDVTLHMAKLLRIDAGNLTREYETHPGWQGLIAAYHAEAKIQVMRRQDAYDNKEAERYFYLRENFETIFNAKATIEALKMAIMNDPTLQAMRAEIVELRALETQLDAARQSFTARGSMLVSLGAHERSERKTGPY